MVLYYNAKIRTWRIAKCFRATRLNFPQHGVSMDYTFFYLICALTGIFTGFLSGLLGIGGGAIIVPVLLLLYSQQPQVTLSAQLAIGTSLASILFAFLSASYAHIRMGSIDWSVVRLWALPITVGSFIAGHIADMLPQFILLGLMAILFAVIGTMLMTGWKPKPQQELPTVLPTLGIAGATGLMSGLVGIGGGNFIVSTMLYCNVPMVRASAIASALGVPIAGAGALGFIWAGWDVEHMPLGNLGYVHVPAVVAIGTLSICFAPLGVRLARRMPVTLLRRLFALILLVTSSRIAWLSINNLIQHLQQ